MIATAAGLASNLALTVPLALVVLVGAVGPLGESWFVPSRQSGVVERRPEDRERARRQRARARRHRNLMEGQVS